MFQSKQLKEFTDEKRSKIYDWWIETAVSKVYYDLVWRFIENPIFQIKRLYGWQVNVFNKDYDFDGHCLFAIIGYKLERLKKVLENGHAVQETVDMKALNLSIKLCSRLREDKYEEVFYSRHDKKWGEPNYTRLPWNSNRPLADTPEKKELERADFMKAYEDAYKMQKREEKWLYGILHKYLRNWWD